ncbi:MAG: hypothetical protein IT368_13700 [Candidatus Hydrogenedentes bacterium]|nr:hypothetical protein [Candidatus Hydrogenedentota bacterium]
MLSLAGLLLASSAVAAQYEDSRPAATLRMNAQDQGVVYRHGGGPGDCDYLGARDVWVFTDGHRYYMHYDGAGREGWLTCLAVSDDAQTWQPRGPALDFGLPGEDDARSASYGTTFFENGVWHMFYLGTPNVSPAPDYVPSFPYLTMKARSETPQGPWKKQPDLIPFRPKPATYYAVTASPGFIVREGGAYLQFFSATTYKEGNPCPQRTLGIARTTDLDAPWKIDPAPIVPIEEQVENSSLYFDPKIETWFLFTNHIGIRGGIEYTDAIWVYWTKDLNRWDPANKAIVLDGQNCTWSNACLGLPSVLPVKDRLAIFYDAPGGDSLSHMHRDLGLAWLDLPLTIPAPRQAGQ